MINVTQIDKMIQGREKQKKLRPIKQPAKPGRTLLGANKQPTETHLASSIKDNMQRSKPQQSASIPHQPKEPQINTLENVCTQHLEDGNVQTYIDLFYISHKCLPNVMKNKNYFGEHVHIPEGAQNQSEDEIAFSKGLGENLARAEVRHQSLMEQKQSSMNEYNSMAFNYQDQGDYVTACYFYNKVVEIARSSKNKQYELVALLGLGKCFDQENYKDEAIQLLEGAFDDASILDSEDQRVEMSRLIGKELIEIFIKKASECEKVDLAMGLSAYESALKVAKRAHELQSQARISHRIGELYYEVGRYTESVGYQVNYLELLKRSMDEEFEKASSMDQMVEKKDNTQERMNLKFKQMQAHASLAKCYLKVKDVQKAEEHLNCYHKMAKQAKAMNSVADSSYYLAKLFQEKGDREKAVTFYQSYFEAAKSEKPDKKDRQLVDRARVTFAIAKSNRNMDKYIDIVGQPNSLARVLEWKIKRVLK